MATGLCALCISEQITMISLDIRLHQAFEFDDTCLLRSTPKEAIGVGYVVPVAVSLLYIVSLYSGVCP